MSQDNKFHQYGYDHYLKAPSRPKSALQSVSGIRSRLLRNLQRPAVATTALALAAVVFVTVIVVTYPSGNGSEKEIPIVKADLRPLKTQPAERGGMEIPYRDSTILARVGQPAVQGTRQEVENLLTREEQYELVSKEKAIEQAMAEAPSAPPEFFESAVNATSEKKRTATFEVIKEAKNTTEKAVEQEVAEAKPTFDLKEPEAKDLLQKIGASENDDEFDPEFNQKVASAAVSKKPERPQLHAAATSPETIEFVRGILRHEQEDDIASENIDVQAQSLSNIEPAFGGGSSSVDITAGSYFVQLASITDPSRAAGEWSKMQARYDVLANAKFRVQEASLSHGTFYRIQAGPMSKVSANEICDALKAANKSGGCLVVQ